MAEPQRRACPYCAEEILAAAIKCKHCGEFLDAGYAANSAAGTGQTSPPPIARGNAEHEDAIAKPFPCVECGKRFSSEQMLKVHSKREHGARKEKAKEKRHVPSRQRRISQVGRKTEAGIACPRCGGTQFKSKRSGTAKLGAVVLSPLVLAKAGQVKCVTCGAVYKRG